MPEPTTWRSVVTDALWELDAAHRVDGATRPLCVTCGAADGSWPCVSRMVADDLRALLRDAGNGRTDDLQAHLAESDLIIFGGSDDA
jgi:hypothetical protein